MLKFNKKNPSWLKFDLTKGNIQCFIKKKSTDSEKHQRRCKTSRPKNKFNNNKPEPFHQQKLISSIIKNVMDDDFNDVKEITELLNKISHEQTKKIDEKLTDYKNEQLISEEDLFKSFLIFKEPVNEILSQLDSYDQVKCYYKNEEIKLQEFSDVSGELLLMKQSNWNNFSTQIGTEFGTDQSEIVDSYPPLFADQCYLPFANIGGSYCYAAEKQRKSTPIRGENQKFRIKLDRLQNDGRTTLMIRHIPNKYTQQMLIDEINKNHRLKYNFFYLPMDSYNPCNVGYAFINFIDAKFITKFYLQFNGMKWSRFNSEKICQLAYARIQGSIALMSHFQNSNIMKARDKQLRPYVSFGEMSGNGGFERNQISEVNEINQRRANLMIYS